MKTLEQVMIEHPSLSDYGMGCYRDQDLQTERADLRNSEVRVNAAVEWLNQHAQHGGESMSSYRLKHIAEKDIGYITNGVMTAACMMAGYEYEQDGSPNCLFNLSIK